jgi:rod shape-determining protein MreC
MTKFTRKIWQDFKEYILLILLLSFSLYLITVNDHTTTKNFRTLVFGTFASVTSVFSDIISISDVKSENERLRLKTAELMLSTQQLREFAEENKQLKLLLGMKDTTGYELIPAKITSRSLSAAYNNFTIDQGSLGGVEIGMPVINNAGLLGVIYNVSSNNAIVRTLRNSNLRIVVRDTRSRHQGILSWNGDQHIISNLPKTSDIQLGDTIITSEISSIIGIPVPVGEVSELINPEFGLFNDAAVKPFVDLMTVDFVFVVKKIQSKKRNDVEINFFNLK